MTAKLRVLSLFSGIGGLDLAAEAAGLQVVAFVEREPFCQRVLKQQWPEVPIYDDIHTVTGDRLRADGIWPIDLVMGGFPCQPISGAGKQLGAADARFLWPEMARVIRETQCRWMVGENVANLLSVSHGEIMGGILRDLAEMGMDVTWGVWGANESCGAPHQRKRTFLIGHLANATGSSRPDERIGADS